ncbi:MAG: pilus assembly protein PilM [Pseudomonadota bacterium]
MPEKTLGLDIGTDTIKVVQVTGGARDPRVTAFTTIGFKGNEELENSLREICEDDRLRSDTTVSSIDSASFFYRNLKMPFSDPKKIRKIVPFDLEPFIPLPIEQLLVDYLTVFQGDKTDIFAAAVERRRIRSHLEALQTYHVDPKIVDVEGIPLAVSIIEKIDTSDGIVLDIGNLRTTLVLWKDKTIHLVRSLPFGGNDITRAISEQLHIDPEEAERIKCSLGETKSQNEIVSAGDGSNVSEEPDIKVIKDGAGKEFVRLCGMVENTIRAFCAQQGYDYWPDKIYLNGGGVLVPEAKEIISRHLETSVEHVDLKANGAVRIEGGDGKEWRPALMNNALALALRGNKKGRGFNFRQEEFEVRGSLTRYKKEIVSAIAALAVIIACIVANACTDFYLLKGKYEKLNSAVIQVFKDTLPDVKRVVNPVQQLKVGISEEKTKKGLVSGSEVEATVVDILRDISVLIPGSIDFKIDTIVFDPDMIQINGDTDNFNTVDSIKNGLQKSSYFGSVDISSAKLDSSGTRVEFKVILSRRGKKI